MGAYATALPGRRSGRRRATPPPSASGGASRCPSAPGRTAPRWSRRRRRGELDVLWSSGGNFLEVLPDPPAVAAALDRVPLRVHQDIVLTSQMLVEGDDVHPAARRHPLRAGGRRHRDHHRAAHRLQPRDPAPGRRGAQRVAALRRRGGAGPARARRHAFAWADQPGAARARSRDVVPAYAGIEALADHGRPGAVGRPPPLRRRRVPAARRPRPLHAARAGAPRRCPTGAFTVATRRGKQFNSMVHDGVDPLTGAGRDAVYIDEADARSLGAADGAAGAAHERRRARCDGHLKVVRLPARSLQVHWPEGNVLISGGADTASPARRCPTTTRSSPSRCWAPDGRRYPRRHARAARCPPSGGASSTSSARPGRSPRRRRSPPR